MIRLPNVKKPCMGCPFRKDVLRGWLGAERMSEILNSQSFVCHKKTDLQCAGHMLVNGKNNHFVSDCWAIGYRVGLVRKKFGV